MCPSFPGTTAPLTLPQIKVEPALFYQACDKQGLLVYQDMPSLRENVPVEGSTACANSNPQTTPVRSPSVTYDVFAPQLDLLIKQHRSYPCIVTWVSTL